ncbi:MAG: hypothetical protein ACREBQ_14310, partial [Nitrososphaerales archaeon]
LCWRWRHSIGSAISDGMGVHGDVEGRSMKSVIVVAGIVVLIIGLGILVYGVYYSSSTTKTVSVVPQSSSSVVANGMWELGMNLQSGEKISGTAQILSYNATAGPVFLYIQNESTYIYWGGCAPCGLPSGGYVNLENYTVGSNGMYSFTWSVPYTGAFYFVFDNENYNQNTNATMVATGAINSTTSGNTTLVLSGLGVAVVGVIIAVAGATMGGRPRPMKPQAATTTKSAPPVTPATS